MYRLMSGDKLIGDFEKVVFTKKNSNTGCFVSCSKDEADGVFVNNNTYAITNSEDYKDCEQVAVFELDSEVERTAELDYMRLMANMV